MSRWVINGLAHVWREDGHKVVYVYGPRRYEPADVAILHVDMSVVPRSYLRLAERYPITLNGTVRDIRKSTFSENLLNEGDSWGGRVIVKSDRNAGGWPERRLPRFGRITVPIEKRLRPNDIRTTRDYRVYDSLADVPAKTFRNRRVVVERFLPERAGDMYRVNLYSFLGSRSSCLRLTGPDEVVNSGSAVTIEPMEAHPAIEARRREFGFDYGKFDYVIHAGEPVLLDINKTTGANFSETDELRARRRHSAEGLYSYL